MTAKCNQVLKAEGAKAWPRTCARCGIGPCEVALKAEASSARLKMIAGLIVKLPYRDMKKLANRINAARTDCQGDMTEALLKASDEILAGETPASLDLDGEI